MFDMTIIVEDECAGCPKEIGCLGSSCPNRNVKHYYCDGENCGEEFEPSELYDFYGKMLCKHCLVKQFKKVSV